MGILPVFPKPRQHSSPVPQCKASQSLGSFVPNWKMSGTEHPLAVSETVCCFLAYLQGVGSLLGFDFARHPSPRGAPSMAVGELGLRRPDRRRARRYPYQASLEIEWGSARLKARTRDVSVGGMFIESEDVLWVGAGFRARLVTDRARNPAPTQRTSSDSINMPPTLTSRVRAFRRAEPHSISRLA